MSDFWLDRPTFITGATGLVGEVAGTGVFSFHGSKTLTTGEGGMLVTDRADIYERAMFLRDHGRKPGDKMIYNTEVAYKLPLSRFHQDGIALKSV